MRQEVHEPAGRRSLVRVRALRHGRGEVLAQMPLDLVDGGLRAGRARPRAALQHQIEGQADAGAGTYLLHLVVGVGIEGREHELVLVPAHLHFLRARADEELAAGVPVREHDHQGRDHAVVLF